MNKKYTYIINNKITRKWARIIFALLISSFLFAFGMKFFISSAKTFSSGLGAIPQLITYITSLDQKYFSILYLAINIPLLIVFYFLVKKKFIILTFLWLLLQLGWGQTMEFIPGIKSADPFAIGLYDKPINGISASEGMVTEKWAIIVQPMIGAIISGIGMSIAWKFGASTGGSDIIIYYISTKKQKSPGKIITVMSLGVALTMIIIQTSMKQVPVFQTNQGTKFSNPTSAQMLFGPITWGTLGYVFVSSAMVSILYPKYKKVEVMISSSKYEQIAKYLKYSGYKHGYNISSVKSGYTDKEVKTIRTVMLFLEHKDIVKKLREIDPNVWVSVTIVKNVYGNFNAIMID
ncbi:YitT family protein [Mycoplasma marinum]|uniref:YitT family protein n=1 Tax=Mycoplasma marinum TaxID=1937190 RepID=UPI003B31C679